MIIRKKPARPHALGEPLLVRNAPEYVLMQKPRRGVEQTGRRAAAILKRARHLAVHVAIHAVDNFRPESGLGDVCVDIDDEIIVALFVRGVRKDLARIGLNGDFRQFPHPRSTLAGSAVLFVAVLVFAVLIITVLGRQSLEHRFLH